MRVRSVSRLPLVAAKTFRSGLFLAGIDGPQTAWQHFIMKILRFCSAALIFWLPRPCLAEDPPTCAVATFEARGGISADEAATLSDCLESELIRLDKYHMVARAQMPEIVKAQELSLACADTACAIELGRSLSAQYIVFGSVSRVGSTFVLLSTLANVETAALERTARFEQTGSVDELLKAGIPAIARQLVDAKDLPARPQTASPPPPPAAGQSSLKKHWPWLAGGAAVVAGGAALAAGGGSGDDEGSNSASVAGGWSGRAGTAQTYTVLTLTQSGTSINGTCSWYGSTRRAWGSISGSRVTIYIASESHPGQYDTWNLILNGNSLAGSAIKRDGTPYQVSLNRQ